MAHMAIVPHSLAVPTFNILNLARDIHFSFSTIKGAMANIATKIAEWFVILLVTLILISKGVTVVFWSLLLLILILLYLFLLTIDFILHCLHFILHFLKLLLKIIG